jgi:hypothetical protein
MFEVRQVSAALPSYGEAHCIGWSQKSLRAAEGQLCLDVQSLHWEKTYAEGEKLHSGDPKATPAYREYRYTMQAECESVVPSDLHELILSTRWGCFGRFIHLQQYRW